MSRLSYLRFRSKVLAHAERDLENKAPCEQLDRLWRRILEVDLREMWQLFDDATAPQDFIPLGAALADYALVYDVLLLIYLDYPGGLRYLRTIDLRDESPKPGDVVYQAGWGDRYPMVVIGPTFCEVS